MKPSLIPLIVASLSMPAMAQLNDSPPVDLKQLLQGLKQFKEQNETGLRTRRNTAYQQITAAAASNEKAAAFWSDAVLAVQFAGVDHQTQAVRDWKQGEGEGLKVKECANAARLHLVWLALTIQHSAGAEIRQLLPNVIDFTKQLEADEAGIGKVVEQIDKAKAKKGTAPSKSLSEDTHAKKLHDSILKTSVATGAVAKNLRITDLLADVGRRKKRNDDGEGGGGGWETVPGNVNGIYAAIILPEFRASKDPRLLDYWDMTIRKGQEKITADMPDFEEKQWSQVRKPSMLWSRAQDQMLIGQRNRGIIEMFNLIKAYPQHPDAASWIAHLEALASPAAAPQATTIQSSGTVAPPTAIPSATAPGAPPTATIVPAPAGTR